MTSVGLVVYEYCIMYAVEINDFTEGEERETLLKLVTLPVVICPYICCLRMGLCYFVKFFLSKGPNAFMVVIFYTIISFYFTPEAVANVAF